MDQIEAEYHRTLVELLSAGQHRELAAAMIDGGVEILRDDREGEPYGLAIDVPASHHGLVVGNQTIRDSLEAAGKSVASGQFPINDEHLVVKLRVKRMEVESGWQDVVRELIVNAKVNNNGVVTRLMAARKRGKEPLRYNEANYGSQSEIRIAQELENRQVLFFPLPLAVRADTGDNWRDHREPDFVVCHEGVWGILEVAFHTPERYEKDKDKDAWWKKSGILCVEHYPAERCYNDPARVVDEFLAILAMHRR